jgi:hypothetical protein
MRTFVSFLAFLALFVVIALGTPSDRVQAEYGCMGGNEPSDSHVCPATKTPAPTVTPVRTQRPTETRERGR